MSLYTLTRSLGRTEAPAAPVTAAGRATPGLAVDLTGVSKAFGGRAVLDRLDLAIPPSQFVAVIGRSGCGKSTLLRLLAGLDTPTGGHLNLDGQPLAGTVSKVLFRKHLELSPYFRSDGELLEFTPATA